MSFMCAVLYVKFKGTKDSDDAFALYCIIIVFIIIIIIIIIIVTSITIITIIIIILIDWPAELTSQNTPYKQLTPYMYTQVLTSSVILSTHTLIER